MKIHTNALSKILANQIQQHVKRNTHHDQEGFLLGMGGWLGIPGSTDGMHHTNRTQNRNYVIIPINAEKVSDRIQHLSS